MTTMTKTDDDDDGDDDDDDDSLFLSIYVNGDKIDINHKRKGCIESLLSKLKQKERKRKRNGKKYSRHHCLL